MNRRLYTWEGGPDRKQLMKFAKRLEKIILTQVWFGVLLKIIAKAHAASKNGYPPQKLG
ncbi:hypothetical protein JIR001_12860 [Polycladomyces abyssicola]|uniref:Uncharacterized protein n=1 Tax=Polycladomyces abyssicola TaxID=1125966 RepID=A0A8D5UFZ3_9BACL|nr:hypothetical protein [Polycladomyces abyssicola]BCU81503.1 hypothetical protein JIR001_12860 [Polycladomyces abyssicola]